jgi:hypothetical protein
MAKTWLVAIVSAVLLFSPSSATAAEDEPPFWPTIRHSRIQRWAAGVAIQPRSPGLDHLVLTATAGRGGFLAGVGIGSFGDNIMGGTAVHATWLRTTGNPKNGDPRQTYVGVEAEIMAANISLRGGPLMRVGGVPRSSGRVIVGFSVGYGF